MGGSARTAYPGRRTQRPWPHCCNKRVPPAAYGFPFQVLVGVGGAINATSLAGYAELACRHFRAWALLEVDALSRRLPNNRTSKAWFGGSNKVPRRHQFNARGALPTVPSWTTRRWCDLAQSDLVRRSWRALQQNVTSRASPSRRQSYSSGVHWTFCHAVTIPRHCRGNRPGQRAGFQRITVDHLMASSAISDRVSATACRWTGQIRILRRRLDASNIALVQPLHLGAHRIHGYRCCQPKRTGLGRRAPTQERPGGRRGIACNGQRVSRHAAGRR